MYYFVVCCICYHFWGIKMHILADSCKFPIEKIMEGAQNFKFALKCFRAAKINDQLMD